MTGNFRKYFPYAEPYGIQMEFMQAAYDVIEEGGVGILSSPTGTVSAIWFDIYRKSWVMLIGEIFELTSIDSDLAR